MAYYTKDSIYSQISDGDVEDWSHNLRSSMQPRPGLTNRLRPPKLVTKMYKSYNRNQLTDTGVSLNISFKNNDSVSEAELTALHYNYFQTNFTCISKIGEGSFGEVFNVKSKEDGRMYAVKISKEVLRGGRYRKERLEEARLYKQFSGKPNCLTVYRAWQQHERLYIQMELCKCNLQNYLDKKKELPEKMIWSIFLDILIALKSLHDNNLIHLDIKTENVLISDDGSCKLADFGLVADVDKANRECVMEGDARYVAPEIMRGIFSKSADIFSLGITILKLAGNKHLPPNSQRWVQIRSGLLPDNVLKNLGISLELQQVLKEMISADQATRPSVDILLQHKKFRYFKMQKLFWKNIQQTKKTTGKFCTAVISKIFSLKILLVIFFWNLFIGFYTSIIQRHRASNQMEHEDDHLVRTSQISSSSLSTSVSPSEFANNEFLHSTPVDLSALHLSKESEHTTYGSLQPTVRLESSEPPAVQSEKKRLRKKLFFDDL